jgi:formylglycine-generating enzyme required for sulfatase activity
MNGFARTTAFVWCVVCASTAGHAAEAAGVPEASNARGCVVVQVAGDQELCVTPGSQRSFQDCRDCPEMVVVPAGSFLMGAPETEPGYDSAYGTTQVPVTIPKPFAVGKYSVTNAEWKACVAAGACQSRSLSFLRWARYPLTNVTWYEANAYVAWLSVKTGNAYHLPSEAQREYFTRAGTTTPYWWGSYVTEERASYQPQHSEPGIGGLFRERVVAVDRFAPNPWGIYNVHGNISEWTEDCFNASHTGNPGDGSARLATMCQHQLWKEHEKDVYRRYEFIPCDQKDERIGPDLRISRTIAQCHSRVVRGGSAFSHPHHLRSAHRAGAGPKLIHSSLGFRVVRLIAVP